MFLPHLFYVVGKLKGLYLFVGNLTVLGIVGNLTGRIFLVGDLPPSQRKTSIADFFNSANFNGVPVLQVDLASLEVKVVQDLPDHLLRDDNLFKKKPGTIQDQKKTLQNVPSSVFFAPTCAQVVPHFG